MEGTMGPAIRRYAVLVGWRDPVSEEPDTVIDSELCVVQAFTAPQAIDEAIWQVERPEMSTLAEVASVHLLSPAEEAEIAEMTAS
jgi:nitrogen fixation protein FixH